MMTYDLIRRGLDFERAYATANAVRDRVRKRSTVSTAELRDLVTAELERLYGGADKLGLVVDGPPSETDLWVVYDGEKQPFSRGVLARSILAAGLDLDRAYRLVTELHAQLREEGVTSLPNREIVRRIASLIEEFEGKEAAKRYRIVRRLPRLPRPLVLFIGGASGTGKSTLALELAPLLRIYRINSTDTIRQVMRMFFSPAVLPAIHRSSFEPGVPLEPDAFASGQPAPALPKHAGSAAATYDEQAVRVLVGVRAVVERAIAENMNIVVEGVHLCPPMVPFEDLQGAAYQVAVVLGTLDEEVHRARFLARGRVSGRRAERYLEHFASIREVHDHVIQLAETHDVPILDTSVPEPTVTSTLRVVTHMLEKEVPGLAADAFEMANQRGPALLVIIDGMADRPIRALGGRTPLQAATTPTMDRLAKEGLCGLADPISPGVVPDTAAGTLALFGQSPYALKRGPVEAIGAGLKLSPGDIALRGNLATIGDNGQVIDRRAGRIREETHALAKALDRLSVPGSAAEEVEIRVRAGTEHRLAVVLRGADLSPAIQGSDPGDGAPAGPPLTPRPLDPGDASAVRTARVLALFEQEARKVLAKHPVNRKREKKGEPLANAVITRGPGRVHRLVPLESSGVPLRVACVAGDQTILGIASWLGADAVTNAKMTANLDTDLEEKFRAARKALRKNDLVVLHLKGADIAAHDKRPDLKVDYLERVDRHLGKLLERLSAPLRIALAADHATLSESGQHAADPLPVVIWESEGRSDDVDRYDEQAAGGGELGQFPLQMLLGRIYDLS